MFGKCSYSPECIEAKADGSTACRVGIIGGFVSKLDGSVNV